TQACGGPVTTYDAGARRVALLARLLLLALVVVGAGVFLSALFLPGALAVNRGVTSVRSTVLDFPPLPDDLEKPAQTSVVLAADGSKLADLHGVENRVYVTLDQIPPIAQSAVLATEDAEFWNHHGINHEAILRALVANVRSGAIEQGGSTITQQYVKNALLSNEQTLDRKIREAVYAVKLEKRLSKAEIFERYVNTAYFGDGVYGIGTAAQHYFSKHITQIDVAEAALLAGLIRSPENNNPTRNPAAARARRTRVLEQMAEEGFITPGQVTAVQNSPLGLNVAKDSGPKQPFFVDWVKRVLAESDVDLQPNAQAALGSDEQERWKRLLTGGLVIHTTLDPRLQGLAEGTIVRYLDDPVGDPLASIVTLQPSSGAVATMAVGPKSFGDCPEGVPACAVTKVNPAVPGAGGSGRQPGSSFKPIVIAAALEDGFSPGWAAETSSGQAIEGCVGEDDDPYAPENYEEGGGGYMDMYEAVKRSNNVFHVKLTAAVGVQKVKRMARTLGMQHSPNIDDFGSKSCSLGLGTANVYPLEMAGVFATLANHGVRCAPFAVTRIEDPQGNLIYQHADDCEPVLEQGMADRVTDLLLGPPSPGGTAGYISEKLRRPVAGKTGTTQHWVDAWFNGYVPQYATAAWVGYEIPRPMLGVEAGGKRYERVTGGTIPGQMWADYMAAVLEGTPVEPLASPPPIATTTVPLVVGMRESAARSLLVDKQLKSQVETKTDHRPAGTVVAQSPSAGSDIAIGGVVRLTVSDGRGEPPQPTVPNVVGIRESEAVRILNAAGYDLRTVERPVTKRTEHRIVVAQSPEPGSELPPGGRVTLTVGVYEAGRDERPEPRRDEPDEDVPYDEYPPYDEYDPYDGQGWHARRDPDRG
ncbi:MAG: transglycosylase domain-containing protein, partial [Actinomycetota bacterium]|nr:transglycosylase domain-containing protein [Actinomycetota bacterium]